MDFDFPIIVLEQTDSTSRYLSSLCEEQHDQLGSFTTVRAEFQSAGKGQRGNSWESEAGKNLTFSFVLYPESLPAKRQFVISQVVSLGIVQVLQSYQADGFSVKWPNDIYYLDKKICGILIEVYLQGMNLGRCVCGVGININQDYFLSDAPNPISLCQIVGREVDREELLQQVLSEIRKLYLQLLGGGEQVVIELSDLYFQHLYRKEGYYRYKDAQGEFMAKLVKVGLDGRLFLEDKERLLRSYLFKEVQYII
jgi:BirA family biotin operon repressor/biotin-[acetyl-CoA-carboxylase] ligase